MDERPQGDSFTERAVAPRGGKRGRNDSSEKTSAGGTTMLFLVNKKRRTVANFGFDPADLGEEAQEVYSADANGSGVPEPVTFAIGRAVSAVGLGRQRRDALPVMFRVGVGGKVAILRVSRVREAFWRRVLTSWSVLKCEWR